MNVEDVADRLAIEDVLYRFADAIDRRDWDQYRSVFTDEIDLDYSSYRPGTVGRMTADEWVDRARRLFPGLDASQHTVTNVRVELAGDHARAQAYVRADHVLVNTDGDHVFTLAGYYDDRMVRTDRGWLIETKTLVVRWSQGNRHLMQLAAERAATTVSSGGDHERRYE